MQGREALKEMLDLTGSFPNLSLTCGSVVLQRRVIPAWEDNKSQTVRSPTARIKTVNKRIHLNVPKIETFVN